MLFYDTPAFSSFGVNVVGELIQHLGGLGLRRGYDVAVNVAGGGSLGVAQIAGYDHQGRPFGNQQTGVCVPLWHNKDKSESHCIATG